MNSPRQPSNNYRDLLRYASIGSQIMALLIITVFAGLKFDQWLRTSPLFGVALPLVSLVGIFIKIYRDTSRKNHE